MPLQASGPISISQIRTELINVNASYSLRTLSSAAGKSVPDAMSEFYGYSACPPNGTFYTSFCSGYDLYYTYHNGSCGYYNTFVQSDSQSCGCVPEGTLLSESCSSCNLVSTYASGYCGTSGTYTQTFDYTSTEPNANYGDYGFAVLNICYTFETFTGYPNCDRVYIYRCIQTGGYVYIPRNVCY
jgi:hypothetical protein